MEHLTKFKGAVLGIAGIAEAGILAKTAKVVVSFIQNLLPLPNTKGGRPRRSILLDRRHRRQEVQESSFCYGVHHCRHWTALRANQVYTSARVPVLSLSRSC